MNDRKVLRVVAAAILRDGKFLAAKRGAGKIPETAHRFEFPGGKIEPGESPECALTREISEELSTSVEVGKLLIRTSHTYETAVVELSVYLCRLTGEEPRSREHEELRWVAASRLTELEWAPADAPVLELLASMG